MPSTLLKLLAENRRPFEPIQAKVQAKDGEAVIYLYDPIVGDRASAEWWGGVCPQDFVPMVRGLDVDAITLYTNCPGGDVFAAEAMCQALREHRAKVTMQIEGFAASAATSIACACDSVVATPASKYMIHRSWTVALGNEEDLMHTVELLRNCDASMYDEYEKRTGQSRADIIEWCRAETWFSAADAAKFGFIDSVLESDKPANAAASRHWNLSAYANAPQVPTPAASANQAAPAQPAADEPTLITLDHRERLQQRLHMARRLAHQ